MIPIKQANVSINLFKKQETVAVGLFDKHEHLHGFISLTSSCKHFLTDVCLLSISALKKIGLSLERAVLIFAGYFCDFSE